MWCGQRACQARCFTCPVFFTNAIFSAPPVCCIIEWRSHSVVFQCDDPTMRVGVVFFFALASHSATTLLQGSTGGLGRREVRRRVAEASQLSMTGHLRTQLLQMRHLVFSWLTDLFRRYCACSFFVLSETCKCSCWVCCHGLTMCFVFVSCLDYFSCMCFSVFVCVCVLG